MEEVTERCGELIAADESTVITKPLFDAVVVEDSQGDRCLPDSAGADESEWGEALHKASDLIDQVVTPEEGPRWSGRQFTGLVDLYMRRWIH